MYIVTHFPEVANLRYFSQTVLSSPQFVAIITAPSCGRRSGRRHTGDFVPSMKIHKSLENQAFSRLTPLQNCCFDFYGMSQFKQQDKV